MFALETPRLILRDLKEDDWSDFHALSADPNVTRYMDFIKTDTEEAAQQWVQGAIYHNQQQPRLAYSLAIVRRRDNQMIGWLGIGRPSITKAHWGDLDFGYALNRRCWGQGYMTEALNALLAFCFKELAISKIFGECDAANPASARVMEKAGLQFEERMPDHDEHTGELSDTLCYSITIEMWERF